MAIDPTALTALIISLVALVATFAQLLQQYFATADGYRQCLPEVMGADWGAKTRKKMRWRELRYETLYYVPSFSVEYVSSANSVNEKGNVRGIGEKEVFNLDWERTDFNLERKYMVEAEEKTNAQMQDEGVIRRFHNVVARKF